MSSALPKLAGFAGALALLFTGGALAGGVIDPTPPNKPRPMVTMAGDHAPMTMSVRGLAVAENGLRLVVDRSTFPRGRGQQLRFRVVDRRGAIVRDFDVEHTKRMHLIVVRRDMTGFQHLHPVEDANGIWSVRLRLTAPGAYRMFADFSHDQQRTTLATDLDVDGVFAVRPLPSAQPRAGAGGGYSVGLSVTRQVAGRENALRFTVLHDGRPVRTQPYLGAGGHLVVLREGDLGFLHVHPAKGMTFEATYPTAGRYRLFLQFKVDGRVHTAAFTREVI